MVIFLNYSLDDLMSITPNDFAYVINPNDFPNNIAEDERLISEFNNRTHQHKMSGVFLKMLYNGKYIFQSDYHKLP